MTQQQVMQANHLKSIFKSMTKITDSVGKKNTIHKETKCKFIKELVFLDNKVFQHIESRCSSLNH